MKNTISHNTKMIAKPPITSANDASLGLASAVVLDISTRVTEIKGKVYIYCFHDLAIPSLNGKINCYAYVSID